MSFKGKKRATVEDIARLANVSVSTASRVFNPSWDGKIKDSTRKTVLAAAQELGYFGPNALVRGLNGHKTNIIALLIGQNLGMFYSKAMTRLIDEIRKSGRHALVLTVDPAKDNIDDIVADVYRFKVDGLIITSPATLDIITSIKSVEVPIVSFNRWVQDAAISCVYCDNRAIGRKAADYFIDKGHHKLAAISGLNHVSREGERVQAFAERVTERGGQIVALEKGDYSYQSALIASRRIFEQGQPDGIYCCEDMMAAATIDVAQSEFGLKVPQDLSVMGMDNTIISHFKHYDLTTMAHPFDDMIASTIDILELLIDSMAIQYQRVYSMDIIERSSVRDRC